MMVGHLILHDDKVTLIDPPHVPSLLEAVKNLGSPDGIILTTVDHLRGSVHIARKLNTQLYVPSQKPAKFLDPAKLLKEKNVSNYELYGPGSVLPSGLKGMTVRADTEEYHPYIDEMILLTESGEIFVGDIASGNNEGNLLTGSESFTQNPTIDDVLACFRSISKIITETEAVTMFSSHGFDIKGTLQNAVSEKKVPSRAENDFK